MIVNALVANAAFLDQYVGARIGQPEDATSVVDAEKQEALQLEVGLVTDCRACFAVHNDCTVLTIASVCACACVCACAGQ